MKSDMQQPKRLILASTSPRLNGLHGTLAVETIDMHRVGKLIHAAMISNSLVSFLSFPETCDVLAMLAGLRGIHRHNKERDNPDLTLKDGEAWLCVTLKKERATKSRSSVGAIDFDYTLMTFSQPRGN